MITEQCTCVCWPQSSLEAGKPSRPPEHGQHADRENPQILASFSSSGQYLPFETAASPSLRATASGAGASSLFWRLFARAFPAAEGAVGCLLALKCAVSLSCFVLMVPDVTRLTTEGEKVKRGCLCSGACTVCP